MPFKPEIDPVYDAHLRAVAQEIGKTIARADDFFTSGVIMDEIWTAILESKIILAQIVPAEIQMSFTKLASAMPSENKRF